MPKRPMLRRLLKILLTLLMLFVLGLTGLYYTLQSPRFLRFLVGRLNQSISGEITYQLLNFDLDRRNLQVKGLAYKNKSGETILWLENLDLDFKKWSLIRLRLDVSRLRIQGLSIDQGKEEKKLTPSTWRTTLRLLLKRVSFSDALFERIIVRLRNGDEFYFDQATVTLSPQVLTRQEVSLWVNESKLKPGNLEIHSSTLSFQGEVHFPVLKDYSFLVEKAEGRLFLSEITVGNIPATSLDGAFEIDGETLSLEKALLTHADGVVNLEVDYTPVDKSWAVDLRTARPFPLSSVPKVHKELLETFDKFELEIKAVMKGYKLAELSGDISLKLKTFGNTANKDTPQNTLTLSGKMVKGVLQLRNFLVQSAKMSVTATGSLDFPRKKMDTAVNAKNFDVATLVESISDLDLIGYADAKGTVRGDFKNPTFQFTAQARETGYNFLRFGDIQGNFKIDNNILTFEGGTPGGAPGTAKVQVKTENIFKKEKRTSLTAEYQNLDVSKLVDNPDLQGNISGTWQMTDTSDTNPVGLLKAKIDAFRLLDFQLGELSAEAKLGNRQFIVEPVTFQPPNFQKMTVPKPAVFTFDDKGLKLTGEVLPGAAIDGHFTFNTNTFFTNVNAKDVDLRPLMASLQISPMEARADGTVKLEIGLENTPTKVDILATRLSIPLEDGEIREAEPIQISVRPPKILFNRARLRSGLGALAITGAYVMDGNSDLGIQGNLDLGILNRLYPKLFREGAGLVGVDLKLSGNLDKPRATGEIAFEDADLRIRGVRGTIEGLNGRIRLTGNALEFDKFRGSMAEGDITLDGSIALDNFTPTYFDVKIGAQEATFSDPGNYRFVFSGDF